MAARLACLDLDTFFVSVERLLDPSLVGVPVVVGGRKGDRGVVTSCSYEVRGCGVHSGMSLLESARLAPHATFVPTRSDTYATHSAAVKAVLERWCPVVQTASIDEFFRDFAGCERLYAQAGDADRDATIARTVWAMRDEVQAETGLPASVGIGASRAVAKMASGRAKPAGVVLVREGQEEAFAHPLPVRKLPGIGPVAERTLLAAGIRTLGELAAVPEGSGPVAGMAAHLRASLAPSGPLPARDRPAFREHDLAAEQAEREVLALAVELLRSAWSRRRRVRLLGVQPSNLSPAAPPGQAVQLPLFPPPRPRAAVAIDAVREQFGYGAIRLGAAEVRLRRGPSRFPSSGAVR